MLLFVCLQALIAAKPRKQSDSRVHLLHADKLYYKQYLKRDAQILVGNVRFRHDDVIMTCDSALFYEASNSFDAFGRVRMLQGDTLSLVSDVLFYNGFDQMARARYNVLLTHRKTKLYCDSMDYDRLYDLGYFFEGGKLVDKDNTLTSEWGQYSPGTREAVFNYDVQLEGKDFTLVSDTLHYNTGSAIAHIVGPSNIDSGDNHIYSERGFYNTNNSQAHLLERSIVQNKGRSITGDSLDYSGPDSIARAFGNVIYIDEVNKNRFEGQYGMYDDIHGYAEAADSAVLIDYSQRDTLYCHADTFKLFTYDINTDSVWREGRAYNHVRAYRRDLQAVCDSMVFISRDSCLTMYKDPIVWQEGNQLVGEEIKIWTNDSTIDSTQVIRQALSIERLDSLSYNQIAGNIIHSYFHKGRMAQTVVENNVVLNYFPFDDENLMVGMLHLETTLLRLVMDSTENKVDSIWAAAGSGKMYPLALASQKERFLERFEWFDYIRPMSKHDIWVWRGKKEGSELKKSAVHSAPKQTLDNVKKASKGSGPQKRMEATR
ncbi:MAG: hypothetical protein IKO12_04870 [Bacteroidaceae bacterium]|nr:hypothetical protein [Bacteroidaceae bacterium]